ncbi:hypothetical protein SMI01S_15290 [Sphingobacterium mizutaii NBRC 14946 = DSM 11724]|uniref:Tetratricopeptide repeat-containing protein n=2 Tax=Sphingobacterium mizutaii TaxID=1010 RepID=A0AAJ4X9G3_9SPHI|nr:hypothetical protein [Sphingobacterium mizutaii]GEM67923.1 hypothetical protein SMI01S_15290 [Sphingobacterium mizutaii NBRC 14946 = DSM 11724]SDL38625.1 hypothetical protein SAMN05192578_103131 [Sphingobacterium mizutaii]SNV43765.1 Uncharacterised protein [Sphingobacterium mizutaii]
MTNQARKIVIAIAIAFLLYAIYAKHYNIAVYIFGGITYLVWSYLKEGTVYLATQAFHKQDYEKTKRLLAEIKNPDKLRKGRRNFYEFMMGNIALKEDNIEEAEYHFQLASRLPWRKDNEKGMVLINLANINLRKHDYERVQAYLDVANKLRLTARQQSIIEKIQNEVNKNK